MAAESPPRKGTTDRNAAAIALKEIISCHVLMSDATMLIVLWSSHGATMNVRRLEAVESRGYLYPWG